MSSPQSIGGQAVIEGVMMRDRQKYSIAVRLPDGRIETMVQSIKEGSPVFKKPFLRGIKALVENLKIGYASLQWSADRQETEKKEKESSLVSGLIVMLSAFCHRLFMVLPNLAVHWMGLVEERIDFV